jgi:hypothetical protein
MNNCRGEKFFAPTNGPNVRLDAAKSMSMDAILLIYNFKYFVRVANWNLVNRAE